jgi:tetratricopeptide (TPR) repeat protein/tRNA A-37 threonylcarbamoyl transferase component Bud32
LPDHGPSPDDVHRLHARPEELIERFETAYRTGQRPPVEDFLPSAGPQRQAVLVELARAEMVVRLQAGERIRAEDYFLRFPELADSKEAVDLIATEYEFHRRRDPGVTLEDYFRRFPQYRAELQTRLPTSPGAPLHERETMMVDLAGKTPRDVPIRRAEAAPAAVNAEEDSDQDASEYQTIPTLNWAPPERPPLASPVDPPSPDMPRVEGYEILGVLGRGGMGVVYKARQVRLQRLVALKMILAGSHASRDEQERLRTEAEAVARIEHPNIVHVYEIGEHEGKPFLCLEFCAGGSLQNSLQGTPLPPDEAAGLMETLARAVHAAHEKNVIHRDLKPANILLAEDGTPKITDFGLAKKADEISHTVSGAIMGTPSYMAPEQAGGKNREVCPATDVWALGAILYQFLTGSPPFKAATALETMAQVVEDEPVPPRRCQSKTPRDLETICLKCLQKDKWKRYTTAQALADDLRRFLNREPILGRPTPAWERAWKWGRRKPLAAALVGVTLLAAVTFVAAIGLYARYQAQQARFYEQELKRKQEQEELRERIAETLLRARQYEAEKKWDQAHAALAQAEAALDAQPELSANDLRAELERRKEVVGHQLREAQRRLRAQQRRASFQGPYQEALFHETLFTGLPIAENLDRTRTAARAALALYGLGGETLQAGRAPELLAQDRPYHDEQVHARLASACYELLLIWAQTEAAAPPGAGETSEQDRLRADKALTLLSRAAELGQAYGLDTRAYHRRKARYQAQSKGEKADTQPAGDRVDPGGQPTEALDWFLEALERYRAGHYADAAAACREVLRLQDSHFWARYVQALCHLRLGRWVEGRGELTVCLSQRPAFVWPRLVRGFASSELGRSYQKKAATDPAFVQLAAAEFRSAQDDLDTALRQDRSELVQYVGLANRGALNIHRGIWTDAIRDLRQAVQVNKKGFQAYVNLAKALEGLGKLNEAVTELNRAIGLAPELAVLYQTRARIHLLRKDHAAARADFERAIARHHNAGETASLVESLVQLGLLLHQDGQFSEALTRYEQALRLRPDAVLPERYRAQTLLELDRFAEAGEALDRYLAATREVPADVYSLRGLIHARNGKLADAIAMYTLALREKPADTETRCYRGWTYLLTDAVRLAREDFDACLREQPSNADALAGRGNVRIRQNDVEGALADAREAEKIGPVNDRLLYNLARVYAQVALHLRSKSDSPRSDRQALQRIVVHEKKALDCLRRSLGKLPEAKRAGFLRNQVAADPALAGLLREKGYSHLEARKHKSASPR